MASLNLFFTPIATVTSTTQQRRVYTAATAAKSSGGSTEEKSLLDFILGALQKQDQLLETDPILAKVEEKSVSSGTTGRVGTTSRKGTVVIPPKKNNNDGGGFGGFGGLFAKKD
ncbi:uncharacterized protein LOC132054696 [Lycium ferocissimum]|uniref:uncharacterized protein LOC132054696 n=1 Tax=Lycium ferocissimum TaxID=112874 RepID=UPI002815356B|nr:uncharacterized protein LOC132054696 [Lycium ferocissimum]